MKRASLRRSNRKSTLHRKSVLQRKAVAVAVSSALMGLSGTAWGQAVTGTIQGTVPAAADEAIRITGGSGFDRTINVDPSGRYSTTVPVGTYTVSLLQNGKVVQSKTGVSPVAAGAVTVVFASATATTTSTELNTIVISARAIPAIDVSTTNQVTTITAEDLQRLPLARDAADIAALAPGVNMGSPQLVNGPLGAPINVFGGATTAENAYYIDGLNVTDALFGQGGIELPYGAIEQQQTFTTGYGAKYGRSVGGVINQIGMSGSDQWHFGVRATVQPAFLQASTKNFYYANPYSTQHPYAPGDLLTYNKVNESQETIYDAYVSGPIIKDKLFFFLAAEEDNIGGTTTNGGGGSLGTFSNTYPFVGNFHTDKPKYYAKINWNINSNNLLTVTGLQSAYKTWQKNYDFDYNTLQTGTFSNFAPTVKTTYRIWVANYTSYLTDSLRLDGMFGQTHGQYLSYQPQLPGYNPSLPYIGSASLQDPQFAPPGISNSNQSLTYSNPLHHVNTTSYRVSLDYTWRTHDIQVGIDNINSWDIDDGFNTTGPGYAWYYGTSQPGVPAFGVDPNVPPYVGPSPQCYAGNCYYVQKLYNSSSASVKVVQRAQYIEDNWHVTPNLLLSLGLRNDQFTNYNSAGLPYIKLTSPQWAPRFGFSWDVKGDSTFKVFGNAGRYYLALPLTDATSVSSPVVAAGQFGTYTGIDPATGAPIGFTPLPQSPSTGVSIDNQYGQPVDARIASAQNVKAEYSDDFVLGLQHDLLMFEQKWVVGATGTYQKMPRIIDDYDDEQRECAAGVAQGYAWMTPDTCYQWSNSLVLINPGVTQHLLMKSPNGSLVPVTLTPADQGFPRGVLRQYYSLDLSLTHVWDGKWAAKIDYVFSKTWGNTEGPVSTYSQQSGSYESITTAWDFPERMQNSYGVLPNDRRHQIKIYGSYAITPDWTVSANLYAASGTPIMCRGGYGPQQLPLHGSHTYYWCNGVPVPPGSLGRMPWTSRVDLNLDYRPSWAGHKLDFNAAVFNVLNRQTPLFINDFFGSFGSNHAYGSVENYTPPRSVRFSIAYDY